MAGSSGGGAVLSWCLLTSVASALPACPPPPATLGLPVRGVTGYGARKGQYPVASPPGGPAPAPLLLVTPARKLVISLKLAVFPEQH